MVKNAYFEVEWTGPKVEVDEKGNVTGKGESEGMSVRCNAIAGFFRGVALPRHVILFKCLLVVEVSHTDI
jgi:hypothetical protein